MVAGSKDNKKVMGDFMDNKCECEFCKKIRSRNGESALTDLVIPNEYLQIRKALFDLVVLKHYKDMYGKDKEYLIARKAAWKQAMVALDRLDQV